MALWLQLAALSSIHVYLIADIKFRMFLSPGQKASST